MCKLISPISVFISSRASVTCVVLQSQVEHALIVQLRSMQMTKPEKYQSINRPSGCSVSAFAFSLSFNPRTCPTAPRST